MATAAVAPPRAIYREEQWFGWWLYAGLAVVSALAWAVLLDRKFGWPAQWTPFHGPLVKALVAGGVVLPPAVVVGALRMLTLVTPTEIRVSFGFLATYRRVIPVDAVASLEVVQYHPVRDYGGWGLRVGRDGERVLTARGDRAVRLVLRDGSRFLIGTQRAEQFALAIEAARRPGL